MVIPMSPTIFADCKPVAEQSWYLRGSSRHSSNASVRQTWFHMAFQFSRVVPSPKYDFGSQSEAWWNVLEDFTPLVTDRCFTSYEGGCTKPLSESSAFNEKRLWLVPWRISSKQASPVDNWRTRKPAVYICIYIYIHYSYIIYTSISWVNLKSNIPISRNFMVTISLHIVAIFS